jgi:hypothetical protein
VAAAPQNGEERMKRRRPRDRSFLHIAAVAASGGLLAVGCAIFLPLYGWLHHRPITPEFFFFGVWGFGALCGAAGCIHTYLISVDPPEKPPKGGVPVRELRVIEGGKARSESDDANRRAA